MKRKLLRRSVILGLVVVLTVGFLTSGQEEEDWDWRAVFADLQWAAPVYKGALIGLPELNGGHPICLGVGDFNEDGRNDLAVGTFNPFIELEEGLVPVCLIILLADAEGQFYKFQEIWLSLNEFGPGLIRAIRVLDADKNGHLDLLLGLDTTIAVCVGEGDGYFSKPTYFAVGGTAPDMEGEIEWWKRSLVVGDFNEDGREDVATANTVEGTLSLFLSDAQGGFGQPTVCPTGFSPFSVVTGDFNEDGYLDVAVVEAEEDTVSIFLGDGAGGLFDRISVEVSDCPIECAMGDFNVDGHLDLVIIYYTEPILSILLGNGKGDFRVAEEYPLEQGETLSLDVGDLNEDGYLDVVIGFVRDSRSTVFFGDGKGSFSGSLDIWAGGVPMTILVADVDQDGHLDFLSAAANDRLIYIANGDGEGRFGAAWFELNSELPSREFNWTRVRTNRMGDFNEDGRMDFVYVQWRVDGVKLMLGTSEGEISEAPYSPFLAGKDPNDVVVGDFDEDGHLDVAVSNGGSNNVSILLGTGEGSFSAPMNFLVGESPWQLVTGDFNEDGRLDIATVNSGSESLSCLLGDGMGGFQPTLGSSFSLEGKSPSSLTIGDFNRDDHLDLVSVNGSQMDLALFVGDGNGSFLEPTFLYFGWKANWVTTGDFNEDANDDLVVDYSQDAIAVFLGNGKGGFSHMAIFGGWPELFLPLIARDFDGDGHLDISGRVIFLNTTEDYPEEAGQ